MTTAIIDRRKKMETKEVNRLKRLIALTENVYDARDLRKRVPKEGREEILKKSKSSANNLKVAFKDSDNTLPEVESTVFTYSI